MARSRDDDDDDDRPRKKQGSGDGGVGAVIPYRNAMALAAYYIGIFALIPCIFGGGILGIIPLVLGILGFMKARSDPEARGTAHALVGIILGLVELLTGCAVIIYFAVMMSTGGRW